MKQYLPIFLLIISACGNRQDQSARDKASGDTTRQSESSDANKSPQLEESFIDSINVGRKTFNKIEVLKFATPDSNFVITRFYSRENDAWKLKNEFQFLKDQMLNCDTKLSDFNNDGLNDMTYVSEYSSRSGNETRKLFIYDNVNDQLNYIKNAEDYPNLVYNKELNCLDAFYVFAGCSTVFLRLERDSLKRFATVDLFDGLTIIEYDKNGNEKILRQGPTDKTGYIRFKNYKPLKEYD